MKYVFLRLVVFATLIVSSCGNDSPDIFSVDVVSYLDEGRDIEMVSLPGGTYAMGSALFPPILQIITSPAGVDTIFNFERPVHVVSVSPFLISSTEITHEQYQAVIGSNPSRFSGVVNMPVENLNWRQAADFCNALSKMMGLRVCYDQSYNCDFSSNGFRLPTEAEWEYAARGGTDLEYSFGDKETGLSRSGWFVGNSAGKPSAVASKEPNQYGLYDMHGNVSEWCQDRFSFYTCGAQSDPVQDGGAPVYAVRGGSWASTAADCRSAARIAYFENRVVSTLGFRIVRRP